MRQVLLILNFLEDISFPFRFIAMPYAKNSDFFAALAFAFVQNESEKKPANNSLIAFTIPEKDLLPENVAYDPFEEAFYFRLRIR